MLLDEVLTDDSIHKFPAVDMHGVRYWTLLPAVGFRVRLFPIQDTRCVYGGRPPFVLAIQVLEPGSPRPPENTHCTWTPNLRDGEFLGFGILGDCV
jgi:hypothetical protein